MVLETRRSTRAETLYLYKHTTYYDTDSCTFLGDGEREIFELRDWYSDIVVIGLDYRWNGLNYESVFYLLRDDVDFVQIIHDEAYAGGDLQEFVLNFYPGSIANRYSA